MSKRWPTVQSRNTRSIRPVAGWIGEFCALLWVAAVSRAGWVLAATILFTSRQIRARIREQIAGRDGEILHAVVLMQQDAEAAEVPLEGSLADPANQLTVALVASRLKGVMGARLFDADGSFVMGFPESVREAELNREELPSLRRFRPTSHFHGEVDASALFYPERDAPVAGRPMPVLEVNVPLHTRAEDRLEGVTQFLIEGHSIAAEFNRSSRRANSAAI